MADDDDINNMRLSTEDDASDFLCFCCLRGGVSRRRSVKLFCFSIGSKLQVGRGTKEDEAPLASTTNDHDDNEPEERWCWIVNDFIVGRGKNRETITKQSSVVVVDRAENVDDDNEKEKKF